MMMKSSIKALHQSLCTLPPRAQTCLCVHESQTDSFRLAADDLYNDFNSIHLGKAEQQRETENNHTDRCCHHHLLPARDSTSFDESSAEPCSSSAASSSDCALDSLARSLSSKRFFFSPCTTNSILEEGKREKEDGSDGGSGSGISGDGDGVFELGKGERLPLREESVSLSVNSEDPFQDFRASMEEMVEALDIREWSGLQELLQCYLRLNEKHAHRFIICAFVDLIMNIADRTKER
ncbi:transcription repressor OFP13-like [Nymphaea colorata]|nr:transcription repressor OFP13-like [Nymphaea colorata]